MNLHVHLRAYLITTKHLLTYFAPLFFRGMGFLMILSFLQFLGRFRENSLILSVVNHCFIILCAYIYQRTLFMWCHEYDDFELNDTESVQ